MEQLDKIAQEAISLAKLWQNRANELLTKEEKAIQNQMLSLLTNSTDKAALIKMIDQSFRSHNAARVADQINNILKTYGTPDFFSRVEKLLVQMFLGFGRYFPRFTIPKMIEKMRESSSRAIIPGEKDKLYAHLAKRKEQDIRMNINHLGEAVLGEEEAKKRLVIYTADMKDPAVEYISVKISTIYSQISSLAFDHSVKVLKERLSRLYKVAMNNFFVRKDGTKVRKFVNLDMEEYRDLDITVEAFIQTLNQEELKGYCAGIVLQAYLPESYSIQKQLTEWAKKRVANGGAPIKIRIVKGANMEMEQTESSINNWALATYDNKQDVDANYKKMVIYGMVPENIKAVNLGIASHNLFELAYAYKIGMYNGVSEYFYFEMLEGMADHVRRSLSESAKDMLLYAPVADEAEFINAIGYLIRRLDENTSEENFLRYSPNLKVDSEEWKFLEKGFLASCSILEKVSDTSNRIQDRSAETYEHCGTYYEKSFKNEADTDFSLTCNRKWAETIRNNWKKSADDAPAEIPLSIAGKDIYEDRKIKKVNDFCRLKENITVANYRYANEEDIKLTVKIAKQDPDGWRKKGLKDRHKILSEVAKNIRRSRNRLIGAAAANTGKIFTEADIEVSEAIDFIEYYPHSLYAFDNRHNLEPSGKGVGLVISPWNFPIAIPCGGISASLAAGNTVIFKPASAAVYAAWELCKCFWDAGISKNTLQFIPCSGASVGEKLTLNPDVDFIILTGGTDTGLSILSKRPNVYLAAETGGKNATIVTAMSDRDQVIKNVISSAFGNAGQKCSATSLLILEEEVYKDENFKKQLVDAAKSFSTGSAWKFRNKMSRLIAHPSGDLKRALTTLEPGETWALKPETLEDNPYLWSPGIKWDVSSGSYTHTTEFFGPLLGVMRAKNLRHAIDLANQTGYGLTSGLESLDKREQEIWKDNICAGNLYINRGATGAIVLRQPFGGMKKSALGAGIKAGGPNYCVQFTNIEETPYPLTDAIKKENYLLRLTSEWDKKILSGKLKNYASDIRKVSRAVKSYIYNAEREFYCEKDYFHLRGQDNIVRYLPLKNILIRIDKADSLFEILAMAAAAKIAGASPILSLPSDLDNEAVGFLKSEDGKAFLKGITVKTETDEDILKYIPDQIERIRYASFDRVPNAVFKKAAETGFYIARANVMCEGRVELINYFKEQAICDTYHRRYGNLGERSFV
ncbi:MAG: bifunctional proline dehydrogenase/L-glutamate gamma-semialdehyde dehydrogenase [Deltaproteobacteria bacterium]|nr:bifunctional proline dehydrogenase/L-glutamate gamma-semialdehyde dehydrogenase [Deltaproteobacteria bacterium]